MPISHRHFHRRDVLDDVKDWIGDLVDEGNNNGGNGNGNGHGHGHGHGGQGKSKDQGADKGTNLRT